MQALAMVNMLRQKLAETTAHFDGSVAHAKVCLWVCMCVCVRVCVWLSL